MPKVLVVNKMENAINEEITPIVKILLGLEEGGCQCSLSSGVPHIHAEAEFQPEQIRAAFLAAGLLTGARVLIMQAATIMQEVELDKIEI